MKRDLSGSTDVEPGIHRPDPGLSRVDEDAIRRVIAAAEANVESTRRARAEALDPALTSVLDELVRLEQGIAATLSARLGPPACDDPPDEGLADAEIESLLERMVRLMVRDEDAVLVGHRLREIRSLLQVMEAALGRDLSPATLLYLERSRSSLRSCERALRRIAAIHHVGSVAEPI